MRHCVIARYRIRNFDEFKAEFDQAAPSLPEHGFSRTWLDRNVNDPNEIVVIHEADDLDRVHAFYESDQYRQCLSKAGVIGEPSVTFTEELAAMPTGT